MDLTDGKWIYLMLLLRTKFKKQYMTFKCSDENISGVSI